MDKSCRYAIHTSRAPRAEMPQRVHAPASNPAAFVHRQPGEIPGNAGAGFHGIDLSSLDAIIRVKSIDDILDVVDDLQMAGYVPQGDFSMIEDMLKLKSTNESQGSLVSTILFVLSVVTSVSLTIINTYLRKSEYAILKMNGYSSSNLLKITLMEYVEVSLLSSIAFAGAMPLLNLISSRTLELSISSFRALVLGCGITMMQGVLIGLVSSVISSKIKPLKNMKSGEVQ